MVKNLTIGIYPRKLKKKNISAQLNVTDRENNNF